MVGCPGHGARSLLIITNPFILYVEIHKNVCIFYVQMIFIDNTEDLLCSRQCVKLSLWKDIYRYRYSS